MSFKNIVKFSIFTILFICKIGPSFSQSFIPASTTGSYSDSSSYLVKPDLDERPMNNIFIGVLGDGSLGSFNYERLFFIDPEHFFISAGAGVGVNLFIKFHNNNGTTYSYDEYIIVPHHITGNVGKGRHFFELGLGGAVLAGPRPQPYLPYVLTAYRIQPWNKNKVNFRLYFSYPLESLDKFEIVYIPAGFSIGWSF